jgi:hypothetical protein
MSIVLPLHPVRTAVPAGETHGTVRRLSEAGNSMKLVPIRRCANAALLLFAVTWASAPASAAEPTGTLRLTIEDAATGHPVPARVEIRGADGAYYVARDALEYGADCSMSDPGSGFVDQAAALPSFSGRTRIENPYTMSTQFYSTGASSVALPSGPATIKVYKGPEHRVAVETVDIAAGATVEHRTRLARWSNMPASGWYSADDHLHIARPVPEVNAGLAKMMQAEDIHVANLLQMGKIGNFAIAQQYAHGPKGHYQEGHTILAAGQENPRTHFLGHTITLGAATTHHNPEKYLIYRLLWQETVKQGAINGFAHAVWPNGSLIAPHDGIAVVAPHDLLHFVEVLQFNRAGYEIWYDLLGFGFRITPTAGTDYPCGGQALPGHERFYTKVEGPLTYANWLQGVRAGRTFVTTGPMLGFRVDGRDIGSEIVLEEEGEVRLAGKASFDPERDDLAFLELVQNGTVIDRFSRVGAATTIEFSVERRVTESSWFAVRGYGTRFDENTFREPIIFGSFEPTTNVHSAPIYVSLRDRPGIEKSARSRATARTFAARLRDLERILSEPNADALAARLANPDLDGVPEAILSSNRPALLAEIEAAQAYFEALAK